MSDYYQIAANDTVYPASNGPAREHGVPVVVLNLEYPEGLLATLRDALSHMVAGGPNHGRLSGLIAEIEAQTRPPKPPEPTGLGAVVEDDAGVCWTFNATDDDCGWRSDLGSWRNYSDISAVRVLSVGVS